MSNEHGAAYWCDKYNELKAQSSEQIATLEREKAELQAKLDSVSKSEPDGYLINYKDITNSGTIFNCVQASLEPLAPPIWYDETVKERTLISAIPLYTSPPVQEGFVMVPLEPTEEMILAGCHHENMGDMAGRYKAMIAASLDEFARASK